PTPPTPTPVNPNTPPQPGASGAQEAPQDHPPSPTPGPGDPNPGPPNRYTPPPALQPLQIGPEVRHTIARTLRRYERRFDACGRSAGLFKPTKIMAQLIISSSGRVTSVTMIATPEQALLSSCIERLLKRIRFSRFRGPLQSVLLPFDFK
ncbi:MAG: hypothetical protein KC609_05975, partial [Myxococcales bacterium]|nr:hypothetical protein [Myxococcales bacterium]